jgi:4-aminobutyrate aminotransferase-like enzyme
MGKVLREGLEALKAKYPVIGDARGKGLMQGLELVQNEIAGDRGPNSDATVRLLEETKKRGLLVGRGGVYGNVLRIAPPLVVSKAEIESALEILDESFAAAGSAVKFASDAASAEKALENVGALTLQGPAV